MRASSVLNKKFVVRNQRETSYPIPLQSLLPIELRDRVSNKVRKDKARPCVTELTVLLQCFKDTDFNQKRCAESMKTYYACVNNHYEKISALEGRKSLAEVKRVRDLTPQEVNQLLKKHPLQ